MLATDDVTEGSGVITASGEPASASPTTARIGYLLSRYPAISHTFFLYEVLGLRALGLTIETASINQPDRALADLPPAEAAEAGKTYYIKGTSKAQALALLCSIVLAHPAIPLRGLLAVMRMPRLTARRRALWLAYLAEALLVGAWMRRRDLQHLHVHFGGPVASVGMLVSAAWGIPYSLTIHGPEELQDFSAYHLAEKLEEAKFILCISDFAKSQLMQRMPPASWTKLHVVRLGVTGDFLKEPATPTAQSHNAVVQIVCVGRLVPEKGHRLLLEAVTRMRDAELAVQATLVGDGVEREALQHYAASLNIEDRITFAGARSHAETAALLRTADIFVLPSFAEGIPVALMEAMALQIPCVSTTVAGISELIRHGQDGLLVAPSNVDALTQAITLLASDEHLRHRLGASARARVMDCYNLPKNHAMLANVLREQTSPAVGAGV